MVRYELIVYSVASYKSGLEFLRNLNSWVDQYVRAGMDLDHMVADLSSGRMDTGQSLAGHLNRIHDGLHGAGRQ